MTEESRGYTQQDRTVHGIIAGLASLSLSLPFPFSEHGLCQGSCERVVTSSLMLVSDFGTKQSIQDRTVGEIPQIPCVSLYFSVSYSHFYLVKGIT